MLLFLKMFLKQKYDAVKSYFLDLAEKVNKTLNKVGYEYCPAEMMASNPYGVNR